MHFPACPGPEYRYVSAPSSGRSAAWLARPSGGREVESSNLSGPTNIETARLRPGRAGGLRFRPREVRRQLMMPGVLPAQASAPDDRQRRDCRHAADRCPTRCSPPALTCGWAPSPTGCAPRSWPGHGRTVADRLAEFTMHKVDLTDGAVLEKGCVYVVPLMERLALPAGITAVANAKSLHRAAGPSDPHASPMAGPSSTASPRATPGRFMPRSARAAFPCWCARASG